MDTYISGNVSMCGHVMSMFRGISSLFSTLVSLIYLPYGMKKRMFGIIRARIA